MDHLPTPRVSILVPIYNESESIDVFLESLFEQDFSEPFEALLIDGMSEDGTRERIREFLSRKLLGTEEIEKAEKGLLQNNGGAPWFFPQWNCSCRVLKNTRKTVPCGLNLGIREARGKYIIRMDAHTRYDPGYIAHCVKWLEENKAENVGGPTQSVAGSDSQVAEAIALASSSIFGVGNSRFRTSTLPQCVDTVPFGAWRKSIFERIGLFEERLTRGQDIEFNARIRKAGGKIFMTPEIRSYYHCDSTLAELWKKHFANGQWNIYTRAISDRALSWRHFAPLIFVLVILCTLLVFLISPSAYGFWPLALVSGIYLVTSLFFSVKIGLREGLVYLLILPVVFAAMHFSYGLGSVWGLLTLPKWLKDGNMPTFFKSPMSP